MPRKATGKPPGRPPADKSRPLLWSDIAVDGLRPLKLKVPEWWIAAANFEVEWWLNGKPESGLRREMARQFTSVRGGGKSGATITKLRADTRYREYVSHLLSIARHGQGREEIQKQYFPECYEADQARKKCWLARLEADLTRAYAKAASEIDKS